MNVSTLWFEPRLVTVPPVLSPDPILILDYQVDGTLLSKVLSERVDNADGSLSKLSPFFGAGYATMIDFANRLAPGGEPAYRPDRVRLFICGHDGDEYCGSVTARLSYDGNSVRWSQFGDTWPEWNAEPDKEFWQHQQWDPEFTLSFDPDQYLTALGQLRNWIAENSR